MPFLDSSIIISSKYKHVIESPKTQETLKPSLKGCKNISILVCDGRNEIYAQFAPIIYRCFRNIFLGVPTAPQHTQRISLHLKELGH